MFGLAIGIRLTAFSQYPALFDAPGYVNHLDWNRLDWLGGGSFEEARRHLYHLLGFATSSLVRRFADVRSEYVLGWLSAAAGSGALVFLYLLVRHLTSESWTALLTVLVAGLIPRALGLDLVGNPHSVSYFFYMMSLWAWTRCVLPPSTGRAGVPSNETSQRNLGRAAFAGLLLGCSYATHLSIAPWLIGHFAVTLQGILSAPGGIRAKCRAGCRLAAKIATGAAAALGMVSAVGVSSFFLAPPWDKPTARDIYASLLARHGASLSNLTMPGSLLASAERIIESVTLLTAAFAILGIMFRKPKSGPYWTFLLLLVPLPYAQLLAHPLNWYGRFTVPGLYVIGFWAAAFVTACFRSRSRLARGCGVVAAGLLIGNLIGASIPLALGMRAPSLPIQLRDLAKKLPPDQVLLYPEPVRTFMDFKWVYQGERIMVSWFGPAHHDRIREFLAAGKRVFADYSLLNMPARAYDGYYSLEHFVPDQAVSATLDIANLWKEYEARPVLASDAGSGLVYYELRKPGATTTGSLIDPHAKSDLGDNAVLYVSVRDSRATPVVGGIVCIYLSEPQHRHSPLSFAQLDPAIRLGYLLMGARDAHVCGRTGPDGVVSLVVAANAVETVQLGLFTDHRSTLGIQTYPFLPSRKIQLRQQASPESSAEEALGDPGITAVAVYPSDDTARPLPPRIVLRYAPPERLEQYRLEAETSALHHGIIVRDEAASGGRAIKLAQEVPGSMPAWGPYIPLPPRRFRAIFRLRYERSSAFHRYTDHRPITVANVFHTGHKVDARLPIWPADRREKPEYRGFEIEFESDGTGHWEFRLTERDPRAIIYLDSVDVLPATNAEQIPPPPE